MLGKELWSAPGKNVVHLGMLFFTQDSSSHQDDITFLVRDPKLNLYMPLLLEGTTQGSSQFPHASTWKISFIFDGLQFKQIMDM